MKKSRFLIAAGLLVLGIPAFFAGCASLPPEVPAELPPVDGSFRSGVNFWLDRLQPPVVVLDPGHGGGDPGAVRGRVVEKELNLQLARALGGELLQRGYRVVYTREDDRFVTLAGRPQIANFHDAALFVSLHHNSSVKPDRSGVECFALTPAGCRSSDGSEPRLERYPGNANDAANLLAAALCQHHLVHAARWSDRGVKFARFRVLCDVRGPALLVEAGFVSNSREAALISRADHRSRVAGALADAIDEFFRRQWMMRRPGNFR